MKITQNKDNSQGQYKLTMNLTYGALLMIQNALEKHGSTLAQEKLFQLKEAAKQTKVAGY